MPRRIPLPTWLWLRPLTWLAMLGAVLIFPWTHASAAPLLLSDDRATVNAWPAATLLSDPSLQLSVHDVLARTDQFVPPPQRGRNVGHEIRCGVAAHSVYGG